MILRPLNIPSTWSDVFARDLASRWRDLVAILNGGVRLSDQAGTVKTSVRWNSTAGSARVGPFPRPARWVVVLSARQFEADSVVVGTPPVTWTMVDGNVVISEVAGLDAGVDYLLDLWILEG